MCFREGEIVFLLFVNKSGESVGPLGAVYARFLASKQTAQSA